ncbi:MAG: hypothetical protein ABEJ91_03630 [Candidatus Nanohaloarchaea archaeon]
MDVEEAARVYRDLEEEVDEIEQFVSRYSDAVDSYFALNYGADIRYIGEEVTEEEFKELNQEAATVLVDAEQDWHRLRQLLDDIDVSDFQHIQVNGEEKRGDEFTGEIEELKHRYNRVSNRLWSLVGEVDRSSVLPGNPEDEWMSQASS